MENGEDQQEEKKSEQSPFVPDLGLPNHEAVNHGTQEEGGAAASGGVKSGGAAGASSGGGEAPLSFRRFLETAGSSPMAPGRPDVAAGLPDFVQDHLTAVAAAMDEPRHRPTGRHSTPPAATGTRRKVPTSLSCSDSSAGVPLGPTQPQGLPDFLSDGPMGTLQADAETNGEQRNQAARPHQQPSPQRLTRLERENILLRRQVDRLQHQLEHERRRLNGLQQQQEQQQQQQQARDSSPTPTAEARLQDQVRQLRRENAELRRRAQTTPASQRQTASQIIAAAAGAEQLISQLMAGVHDLRMIAAAVEMTEEPAAAAAAAGSPSPPQAGPPPPGGL